MLAATPLPHGFGAALASVDTFPRAPEQFVTSPLCLVGYVRWDARSDRVPPLQTIIFSSFPGRTKGCRPTGSYRRSPVARTFKRSFVFEAELETNRLFLSDDTHSFERRTYSSRCLTSRNLCFEPSYNRSDKGFAHPSPEQRQ